jgi:hypothetical protein
VDNCGYLAINCGYRTGRIGGDLKKLSLATTLSTAVYSTGFKEKGFEVEVGL